MRSSIYLTFNGNCAEAFDFYKSVFGGEFTGKHNFEGSDKIMHMGLPVGTNMTLMGCDYNEHFNKEPFQAGNHAAICLVPQTREEADKLFAALIVKPKMPLKDQFWGAYHGNGTDKFGITWMIDCDNDLNGPVKMAVAAIKEEVAGLETMLEVATAKSNKRQKKDE